MAGQIEFQYVGRITGETGETIAFVRISGFDVQIQIPTSEPDLRNYVARFIRNARKSFSTAGAGTYRATFVDVPGLAPGTAAEQLESVVKIS